MTEVYVMLGHLLSSQWVMLICILFDWMKARIGEIKSWCQCIKSLTVGLLVEQETGLLIDFCHVVVYYGRELSEIWLDASHDGTNGFKPNHLLGFWFSSYFVKIYLTISLLTWRCLVESYVEDKLV